MHKNVGILCDNIKDLYDINNYPSNRYIIYLSDFKKNELCDAIDFLISNDCNDIYINLNNIQLNLPNLRSKYKQISLYTSCKNITSYASKQQIILINKKNKRKCKLPMVNVIDYNEINTVRKDAKPHETISKIKNILKSNNYKVRERHVRRNFNGIYSIRLELNNKKGSNGKGISLGYAKASAYAELMERLQSNMLNKKRTSTNLISKKQNLYLPLLNHASEQYKKMFFTLDDIYFNTETLLNIKTNKYEEVPINAVKCFCHTNGLASGNTFSEAVSQAIFEILERHCYNTLLNSNKEIKNIDISKYPLNHKNIKLLKKLKKLGYSFYIKDCSINKYPVLGFLLFNKDKTKYTFTMASDYSLDIALSRCITEMMQGLRIKDLNNKMLNKLSLDDLDKKYKYNYKSYNWLKCFNNNIGYLPKGFFCEKYADTKSLKFKNYLLSNDEILSTLKNDIEYDIYIKDYNILGFDTYRVYIPYITSVDCYDIDDLLVNKNYDILLSTYKNITEASDKDINFFIDIFLKLNKNIKYDELIKPCDLFHLNETTDYFMLDSTSLLIVLTLLTNREKELCDLLQYKINNFNLSKIKLTTYQIIVNILSDKNIYNKSNQKIENYIRTIQANPFEYLVSLNPHYLEEEQLISNKKSLN